MPTATPFTALGRGNGFPFCPQKVNVTDYEIWTTFSGVTGLTATDAEIAESLRLAMLFYWNSYKLNILASFDDGQGNTALVESFNSVDDAKEDSTFPPVAVSELSPSSRVCRYDFFGKFEDAGGVFNTSVGGSCYPDGIVAMYAGDVGDYDKFIGYGLGGGIQIIESNVFVVLSISGYDDAAFFYNDGPDYCSIPIVGTNDSLNAVCGVFGTGIETSASNMIATGNPFGAEITLQMKTIELYTYP